MSVEIVVHREPAEASADPASQALTAWAVELDAGQILIGGAAVHPVVARDLWVRLGALLGQADRDEEHAEWARLAADLDRHFRGAPPARGWTLGSPSMAVDGLVLRERVDRVTFRMATYSIARLRPSGKGWEGSAYALRPTLTGYEQRPLGVRLRVSAEAIAPMRRLELPGPSPTPRRPRSTPGPAPSEPRAPEWLEVRRRAIEGEHAAILALLPDVGASATFEDLAGVLRWPRDPLRRHLETLVEFGTIAETKPAPGRPRAWTRLARRIGQFDGKPATRLTKPPKPKPAAKLRSSKGRAAPDRVLWCRPCGRSVGIPPDVALPADPRCKVCGGPLAQPPGQI